MNYTESNPTTDRKLFSEANSEVAESVKSQTEEFDDSK